MSKLRFRVVETAFKKRAAEVPAPAERPSDYFGQNVFNRAKMFKYLPEKAYERITDCIDNGAPLTEGTAEKHDLSSNTMARAAWSKSSLASY